MVVARRRRTSGRTAHRHSGAEDGPIPGSTRACWFVGICGTPAAHENLRQTRLPLCVRSECAPWSLLRVGAHRSVSPDQAEFLRLAIANYLNARKLMKDWEA